MKRRNLYILTGGENMQRKNPGKAMCYLVVICALVSALALVGCGGDDDDGGGTITSGQTIPSVNTGAINVTGSNVQALVGQSLTFQMARSSMQVSATTQLHLRSPTPILPHLL
jgi:hypothetical protein